MIRSQTASPGKRQRNDGRIHEGGFHPPHRPALGDRVRRIAGARAARGRVAGRLVLPAKPIQSFRIHQGDPEQGNRNSGGDYDAPELRISAGQQQASWSEVVAFSQPLTESGGGEGPTGDDGSNDEIVTYRVGGSSSWIARRMGCRCIRRLRCQGAEIAHAGMRLYAGGRKRNQTANTTETKAATQLPKITL